MNVMENIFTRLMNVDNSETNDYYDEERFLVCGNCHTRKQSLKDLSCIGKGMRKVPCLCKCGIEKREEEERKEKESKRLNRIKMLKEQGIADPQYLKHHLSSDDKQNEKISGAVERYINKWVAAVPRVLIEDGIITIDQSGYYDSTRRQRPFWFLGG